MTDLSARASRPWSSPGQLRQQWPESSSRRRGCHQTVWRTRDEDLGIKSKKRWGASGRKRPPGKQVLICFCLVLLPAPVWSACHFDCP